MIMLGNLTIEQFENRCGIKLTDSERSTLSSLIESTCDKIDGNNKIHIYDIPFMIVCGNLEARMTVLDIIKPYAKDLKTSLQIGGGI